MAGLLSTAILARLISPAAYGVMGMAALFVNFANTFSQFGIPSAVVQRPDIDKETLSTWFWLNLLIGLVITITLIAIAPAAADFFNEPMVKEILPALAWVFVITAAGSIQHALFYREMSLRKAAVAQCSASTCGLSVAIFLACQDAGVWSLVLSTLVSGTVDSVLMWCLHPWRPCLRIRWTHVRSVAGFGVNLSAFGIVNYFSRNGDNLIIGRSLGPLALGYYQNAYSLMLYPLQAIGSLVSSVTLAPLSKLLHDKERLHAATLRISVLMGLLLFPFMLGLMVTSDLVVGVVLGPNWRPSAPVLAVLAVAGLFQGAIASTGLIFVSTGRTDVLFRLSLLACGTNVVSFLVGLHWGIQGVAAAYSIAQAVLFYPILRAALRLIDISITSYCFALGPILASSAGMTFVVLALRWLFSVFGVSGLTSQLVTSIFCGIAAYLGLLFLLWPPAIRDLAEAFVSSNVGILSRPVQWLLRNRRPAMVH